jgi:hypothetical protein
VNGAEDAGQLADVHRLVQTVRDRLLHERMIGDFAIAGDILEAGGGVGKCRSHEVVGFHPLDLRRHPPASAVAQDRQRDRGVPAPARLEHRRVEDGLHQDVANRVGVKIAEDVGERKRVLGTERQQERVLGGRGLQLEIELPAEALAEREAPRPVDPAAEGGVQDELHAARLVEEPFEHQHLLRRQHAEQPSHLTVIEDNLERPGSRESGFPYQPLDGRLGLVEPPVDVAAQLAHGL